LLQAKERGPSEEEDCGRVNHFNHCNIVRAIKQWRNNCERVDKLDHYIIARATALQSCRQLCARVTAAGALFKHSVLTHMARIIDQQLS